MTLANNTTQEPKRFSPLFNDAFLYLFGTQESKRITRSLLNAILREADIPGVGDVGEIDEIYADAAIPGGIECRTARCDVVVVAGDSIYDIESQGWHANVVNKSLFYGAKLIMERTPKGDAGNSYDNMPQVMVITLLHGRKLFPNEERFLTTAEVCWTTDEQRPTATDRLLFVVVEMDKVAERYNLSDGEVLRNESLAWLYLVAKGYTDPGEVDMMKQKFLTMEEFAERYGAAIGDKDLKRAYDRHVSSVLEFNTMMSEAEKTGLARGMEKGMQQGLEKGRELGRKLGLEQGLEQGRELGLERGLKEGANSMAEKLRAKGVDEALIAEALAETLEEA